MSGVPGIGLLIPLIERGVVPDGAIRWGIRRLQKERLQKEGQTYNGNRAAKLASFANSLRQSPVALTPDLANEQHYEVPAAFFERVLGKHLKYSGCYYDTDAASLDDAEARMLAITCKRAQIGECMDILELGCGWGSLSMWIAERYPTSRVVAVSNSRSQREYIERRCASRGLKNIDVITADMNDFAISQTFDRVVSVEMFEHMRNYETLLQRIAGWLKPDGKLFIHIFCHRLFAYLFEAAGPSDWMGRYFFTSGMMPAADLLNEFQKDLEIEDQWFVNGRHYALTSEAWLKNQDNRREEIMSILRETYGESDAAKWFQRWRIFFLACAELFNYRDGEEWGVGHYRMTLANR